MLYWILKPFGLILLFIFFKKIDVQGKENIPHQGPLIFAGNHPNMLLDALLIGAFTPRKVHYLAKSTLFHNLLLGAFLRSCGVIPIYRRQDNPQEMKKNQSSFSACYEILEKNGSIGIFPEGTSHAEPHLMSLKTGAARISLQAEEQNNWSLGIQIVPVGLNYKHRDKFRTQVLIQYGKPIEVKDYKKIFEKDPKEAAHKLTQELEKGLRELTINLNSQEDYQFIQHIERIYRKEFLRTQKITPKNELKANLLFNQALVDGYRYFLQKEPWRVKKLKGEIQDYIQLLDELELDPELVGTSYSRFRAFQYLARNLVFFAIGLPIAAYGIVNHFLPYQIPGWYAERKTPYLEEKATLKLVVGMVVFPLFYIFQTLLVGYFWGISWAFLYLVSLMITGFITLIYLDKMYDFFRTLWLYLKYLTLGEVRKDLERRRSAILEMLDQMAKEFQRE